MFEPIMPPYKVPHWDRDYEIELERKFHTRKPQRVFDAHFHLSAVGEIYNCPPEKVFDTYIRATEAVLGEGCLQGGLIMGNPKNFASKELLDEDRHFSRDIAERTPNFVNGLVVRPQDGRDDAEAWLRKYPYIVALKPYRMYAPVPDTQNVDILDFAPEWMWQLASDYNLAVVIHLSHDRHMLSDPRNGEQIRYLSQKYPNAAMILAHCAMGHHPAKLQKGLPYLEGLHNVWVDCSGTSDPASIMLCLKALGHEKMLYGTDGYKFGHEIGRVMSCGSGFLALHPDARDTYPIPKLPKEYSYRAIRNIHEGLSALYMAGDLLDLTQQQWDDIFWNNAARLFLSRVR